MTADAGQRAAAFGYLGRGVVRATRAEIRRAHERDDIAGELRLACFEPRQMLGDARRVMKAGDALGDDLGDLRGRQLAGRGKDPDARLVMLADDARPGIGRPIVELLLELGFDDRALFL